MKASISYYPNTAKKSKKTGKIPLYSRICLQGTKAEERINIELTESDLLKWDPMTMRLIDRSSTSNFILNNLDNRFHEFIILNTSTLSRFSARSIMDHIMGKQIVEQTTVWEFANLIFESSIKNNQSLSPGTVRNYRKALNHLLAFLQYRKSEILLVTQLNHDFASEFKDYLLSATEKYSKKAMSEVSAAYIIKKFRTIFDRAVDKDLLKKNPFKSIKLKTKSPRRERLNIDQVRALYQLDCTNLPIQKVYRDIFLFCVFTGLANIDAQQLKHQHLLKKEDGNIKLSLKRTKTNVFTESFLVSSARTVVHHYQSLPETKISGFVLPHRSNKELNVQLKILASLCNIPFKLTSHIARHTFRQLLAESGIEDLGVIKRMMGQSRGDEIDDIYYSITESRLLEAKNKFENFLNKNLLLCF
jgi:integrase